MLGQNSGVNTPHENSIYMNIGQQTHSFQGTAQQRVDSGL